MGRLVRMKAVVLAGALVVAATAAPRGQQAPQMPPPSTPVFKSSVNLILVDVVVRDRNGVPVTGLTIDDFDLLEDGMRQRIITFAAEQITGSPAPLARMPTLAAAATTPGG